MATINISRLKHCSHPFFLWNTGVYHSIFKFAKNIFFSFLGLLKPMKKFCLELLQIFSFLFVILYLAPLNVHKSINLSFGILPFLIQKFLLFILAFSELFADQHFSLVILPFIFLSVRLNLFFIPGFFNLVALNFYLFIV